MVRVHFAEREPIDYDGVTELEFTAAGAVVLRTQPLTSFPDPQNLQVIRTVPTGPPRLLGAWSKDAHWTQVEEIPDAESAADTGRHSLEVAR